MGMPTSVTLSSVGTSNAVDTDWMASKPVTWLLTFASTTMTGDATVQYTLDQSSASTRVWFDGSSHISAPTAVSTWWTGPMAGLRISSTAISSSSMTLRVLQGIGW